MTWPRLVRAELRKLSTTRMPWAFLGVLVGFAVVNAALVVAGTDMDGTKTFISTAADQQSMMAFAANAFMLAGLLGAIATAREYGHGTVVPTFLTSPRRHLAVLAQLTAVSIAGAVLGLVGAALTGGAMAAALPSTDFAFMVPAAELAQVLAASTFAGAAGAVLGAGIGATIRNPGGAATGAALLLFVAPPLVVQLVNRAADWIHPTLTNVLSGVSDEVTLAAAIAGLAVWALIPAALGLITAHRRDVT